MGLSASSPPTHRLELGGYLYFVGVIKPFRMGRKEPLPKGVLRCSRKYLYFSMKIPLLFGRNTSTSKRKYLNFSEEVSLLPAECYITFGQMLYYFSTNVILLLVESYITFCGGLYDPPCECQ